MNPDLPIDPKALLESKLTALLLDELPHDEAAALHLKLAQDPQLATLYERLKLTIHLVRETVASPAADTAEPPAPLKLADDRRQKLLAQFKTVKPKEFSRPRWRAKEWLMPLGIAAGLVIVGGSLLHFTLAPRFSLMSSLSSVRYMEAGRQSADTALPTSKLRSLSDEGRWDSTAHAYHDLNRNGVVENYTKRSPAVSAATATAPPAGAFPPPAKSAGAAIVLPNTTDFSDVGAGEPNKARASDRWDLSASTRGFYNEPRAASPSAGDWGAFAGYGESPLRGADAAEGRPKTETFTIHAFGQTPSPASPGARAENERLHLDFDVSQNPKAALMDTMHSKQGNVGLADGSLQGFSRSRLQEALRGTGNIGRTEEPQAAVPALNAYTPANADAAVDVASAPAPEPLVAPAARLRSESHDSQVPVPAQTPNSESLVAGLPAGGRAGESGRPPAEVLNQDDAVQQLGIAWSDASKKRLDRPAAAEHLFLEGVTTTPGTKGRPLMAGPVVSGKPAAPVAGFGLVAPATGPATAGKSAGSSVSGTKPVEFGAITQSPNSHWYYDAAGQPRAGESDGDNLPTLGDVPALGRFYREGDAAGGRGGARLGETAAPGQAGQPEGPTERLARANESLSDRGRQAGAEKSIELYVDNYFGGQASVAPADGRTKYGLSDGALQLKNEEKVKSLDQVGDDVAAFRMEHSESEAAGKKELKDNVYSLDVTGYVNVPADAKATIKAASPARSPIVLPGAQQETQLSDSNGLEQRRRQLAEATRQLGQAQQFSSVLDLKIASEGIDADVPKTKMVEIADKAVPASAPSSSLWDKIHGKAPEYKSKARVKVERDQSDIAGMAEGSTSSYDPYFVQTESELIESEAVLGKVIKDLKLNETWGRQQGGRTLTTPETIALLRDKLELHPVKDTSLLEIGVKSDKPDEAARIANAVAEEYKSRRLEQRAQLSKSSINALEESQVLQQQRVREAQKKVDALRAELYSTNTPAPAQVADVAPRKPAGPAPIPQPEVQSSDNAFSTFSLNVSDVSYKLAGASIEKGVMPEPASIRSEEFINAFDYRDPEPPAGVPVAFAWERAQYPFAQNRDLLRFSIKTAALGRQPGRPLNLVLLLDNSGSMERADRVQIIREALRVLAGQLQPQDKFSVVTFSRTAHLWVDGVPGSKAAELVDEISGLTPQGGTNLEDAMNLAYQTALRHYLASGVNRVVLLTDGAANLGNVEPEALKQKVEANRKQGIALDCFGIGWEGFNDDLLEVLSRNGDGRYGFVNTPEEAATEFASQLAGALHVAASDVKVQVEFNPARVTAYRQIGYAKHQLTEEQFRDNTVDAAEIAAQEAGNALYVVEVNPRGNGPLATVRVRFKIPGTSDYREHEWPVPFAGNAVALEQASPAMRLAATASAFSEWLASSPYAGEVSPDRLLGYLSGVPEVYGADARPRKLEWMIRQAKSIAGK